MGARLFRRRTSRRDRDLDRLALLERLSRGRGAERRLRPVADTKPQIARYARFRQVGSVVIALGVVVLLFAVVGAVLSAVQVVEGEVAIVDGAVRVLAWLCAGSIGYGLLKGLGEVLLLWCDVAELLDIGREALWRERAAQADSPAARSTPRGQSENTASS